jgi:long-chain acyl-CoA synthetase
MADSRPVAAAPDDLPTLDAATAEASQRRAAAWLADRALAEGDRIAIVATSTLDVLVVGLAALRRGIVPVLVNPALTTAERQVILDDAEPALVLSAADLAAAVTHGEPSSSAVDLHPVPRSRPMLYTSGTTGRPKGVWTGLLDDADAEALVRDEADLWGFAADDRHLVLSRLYHSAPFRFAAGTLLAGGTVALAPDAHDPAAAIRAFRPTTTFLAPVHLQRLLDHPDTTADDLASFRLAAHAGAPCPTPLKERAVAAFRESAVWEFYGSTEGQFTVCSPEDWRTHPGSVGRARPGRTLHVDDDGTIWCRPPAFARFTYWRDEAKTAAAWKDGAFTVGDLGRLDEDGFLHLDGRRDDLIITGGVNVYPLEVERVLLDHPAVREAVVFPLDDERWGQMVCAAVVGPVAEDELRAHVEAHLAPYKRPKRWFGVEALPHTPTGKLRRSLVAGQLDIT